MSAVLDCRVYLRAQIWWARQTQNVSDAEVCYSLFCAHSRVYMTHIGSVGGIATLVGTKACLNRVITREYRTAAGTAGCSRVWQRRGVCLASEAGAELRGRRGNPPSEHRGSTSVARFSAVFAWTAQTTGLLHGAMFRKASPGAINGGATMRSWATGDPCVAPVAQGSNTQCSDTAASAARARPDPRTADT